MGGTSAGLTSEAVANDGSGGASCRRGPGGGISPRVNPPERTPLRWNTPPDVCSLFAQGATPWIDRSPIDPVTFMESTAYGSPGPPAVGPGQFPGYHMPPADGLESRRLYGPRLRCRCSYAFSSSLPVCPKRAAPMSFQRMSCRSRACTGGISVGSTVLIVGCGRRSSLGGFLRPFGRRRRNCRAERF